jgi:hypothetical protein
MNVHFNMLYASLLMILSYPTLPAQKAPYPPSPVIEKIEFNWSTHLRFATGSDNWPITWADDDHQYTVWGDGGGFYGTNRIGRSSIGIARIEGNWHDFRPTNIWGGHASENDHNQIGKSYGIVCIDKVLYMWVGMFNTRDDQFDEVKIAFSKDYGASWSFSDWNFNREQGIMMPTVCNYGRNYEGAKDDYVYHYLIRFQSYEGADDYEDKVDWLNVQNPGIIDLARVPKHLLLNRNAYDFYAGLEDGHPVWTKDIHQRKPVFENTAGVGWCINVSFNAGLGRYLLTTEHTESHRGNMGIFDAPNPWGPWTTVHYQERWGEDHVPLNTFFWNFSNKWTSGDGKSFSLIFTGRKENDSFNIIRGRFEVRE